MYEPNPPASKSKRLGGSGGIGGVLVERECSIKMIHPFSKRISYNKKSKINIRCE